MPKRALLTSIDLDSVHIQAKKLLERRLPDPAFRTSLLKAMAESIQFMHARNPNCWSINVGKYGPYINIEHEIAIYSDGASRDVRFHVYLTSLDPVDRRSLESGGAKIIDKEDEKWSEIQIRLPEQEHLIPFLRKAHKAFLMEKARHNINSLSINPHIRLGAGVIEYMQRNLSMSNIPQPGYLPPAVNNPTGQVQTAMNTTSPFDLSETLLKSIAANGLQFTRWQVATFYTALQTKGFVILSGISGTGKTKLAQAFARLLPQPSELTVIPDDIIRITVRPYMLKYNRMIIPKSWVMLFTPPEAGVSNKVELEFDGQKESCLINHYQSGSTDYVQLLLKGKARIWFQENFSEESTIALEMQLDQDGKLFGFKLGTPDKFTRSVAVKKDGNPQNYLFLSVRPDWRDSKSLLGFYNPIEQEYQSTQFIEFIRRAAQSYEQQDGLAWFVVLDEMNLARVEYYFADLLSVIESGRENGWSRESIRLDYPTNLDIPKEQREIRLPPNLYFIGTVNVDETTHAFSPKVLDRAFTLELTEADFSHYPPAGAPYNVELSDAVRQSLLTQFTRQQQFAQIDKAKFLPYLQAHPGVGKNLCDVNDLLQPYDLHFGYRVFDEIVAFLDNAELNCLYQEMENPADPFDAAILIKVLPKFHGSRSKLEEPLKVLLQWCLLLDLANVDAIEQAIQRGQNSTTKIIQDLGRLNYRFPCTAKRIIRMLRALYTTGFAAFG